jgi:hypothetical protein
MFPTLQVWVCCPVIAVRVLDGRVGSTLLIRLLTTSTQVVIEPGYAEGERRYLSYCLRIARLIGTPWVPAQHPDATDLMFGPADLNGPIPFEPTLVDIRALAPRVLHNLWQGISDELRRSGSAATYYAEKLVGDTQLLLDSQIPVHLIDVVRDPRDVFCSIRAFNAGVERFGRSHDQSDDEFLGQMIARHGAQLRMMASTPSTVRRKLVRYEDMVADLTTTAEDLGAWLGLRLNARPLLRITDQDRQHMTSRTPIDSVGRWRRELPTPLSATLWRQLGGLLEPLGYDR